MGLIESEAVVLEMLWGACADRTHVQVVIVGSRSQAPQYALGAAAMGHKAPCRHWCCTEEKRDEKMEKLKSRRSAEKFLLSYRL